MRVVLSQLSSVQSFLDAADANEALDRIYHDALPVASGDHEHTLAELQALRPFVLVSTDMPNGFTATRESEGSVGFTIPRGVFELMLERDVPEDVSEDPAAVEMQMKNHVGKIIDGLITRSGVNSGIDIRRIVYIGLARSELTDEASLGDAQRAWLRIEWGRN